MNKIKNHPIGWFFCFGAPEGIQPLRVLRPLRQSRTDFATKNSPPDCFLNVAHPLRVRIPRTVLNKKTTRLGGFFVLARPKGFEPLTF